MAAPANIAALSPAEALLLLDPGRANARNALKITLMTLLLRGVVRIEQPAAKGWFRRKPVPKVFSVRDNPAGLGEAEDAVWQLVRETPDGDMAGLVKAARGRFGNLFAGFLDEVVGPALARRGLLTQERGRYLLLFSRTYRTPTPAGLEQQARLRAEMSRARDIPGLLSSDPAQAAAMAVALGGLILLVEELRPHMQAIAQLMPLHPVVGEIATDSGFGDANWASGFDFSALDVGSFDSLDAAMSAMDSGFDAAGGDGDGGDGGGGDGGGGGGE